MLDIEFIKQNKEKVAEAIKNKGAKVDLEELLKFDGERRKLVGRINELQKKKNELAEENKKQKPTPELIDEGRKIKEQIAELESHFTPVEEAFLRLLSRMPNIPTDDTPIGKDESGNVILRKVGELPEFGFKPKEHWELGVELDLIDTEKAGEISGSRFAYLKRELVLMEFALIQYAMQSLTDEKTIKKIISKYDLDVPATPFVPIVPPVMIKPEVMQKMARLEPREERYHIQSDDLYLIGSAEHTLGPLHMNEILEEKFLPIRYLGFSTAFRREAGSYGKDVKGILRVHQFDKLEMESFALPEQGIAEQNFFVAVQEYLMSLLELPYQVVAICTGDMGGPDARQIDIETWMPGQNKYRETHTADYMTDYQSRRLNTKVKRTNGKSEFIHMNDATAVAIGRTIIAIMENYQTKEGTIKIPKVLRPFMGGIKKIASRHS
ncbi:MAG: seryl-tRNA synthetase [Parcubacteria group bacterium Licking1014_17]|nr:MAG: seryl-tRNA synthetase [Parcubacteria group bacterium Licking1014_17]